MNVYKHVLRVAIAPLAFALVVFPIRGADENSAAAAGIRRSCQMPAYGTIAGITRTPEGLPLASATITAAKQDGSGIRATISGSDGIYSFADVAPGSYSVTVQADGYADHSVSSVQVATGRATRLDLPGWQRRSEAASHYFSEHTRSSTDDRFSAATALPVATQTAKAKSGTSSDIFLNRWLSELDRKYAEKAVKTSTPAAKTPESANVASLGMPPVTVHSTGQRQMLRLRRKLQSRPRLQPSLPTSFRTLCQPRILLPRESTILLRLPSATLAG